MPPSSYAITLVALDAILPNPQNVNEGDVGAISTMIATDGFHGAVLCAEGDPPMIYAGEHRWRALAALNRDGFTFPDGTHMSYRELANRDGITMPPAGKVPVQVLPLSDLQLRRKTLSDNRAAALARPDPMGLTAALIELAEEDALLGTGYEPENIDELLRDLDGYTPNLAPEIAGGQVTPEQIAAAQGRLEQRLAGSGQSPREVACPHCGKLFEVDG